jgi:methylamine dehydrogenase heavy chain
MNTRRLAKTFVSASLVAMLWAAGLHAAAAVPPPLQPEVSDVLPLPPPGLHRFFAFTWGRGVIIFNGDTGKIEGQVPAAADSNLRTAADNSQIYVSETLWTHGNRGTRLDLLSIYDGKTLNLVKEIVLPGRLVVGNKLQNLELNKSGTRAYVYNMHPASSVTWVDLAKQAVGGTVETPGCALIFPWADDGFSSLCGDGSMATVAISDGSAKVTHTKPFFDAANDPIFDNSLVDRTANRALFMSYTGLVYSVTLGATPVIEKPWSIQQSAGQKPAGTGIEELAWRPGGVQPIAWHKDSDRLFVLMHPGSYWSHRDGGTEIWVLNYKTHALLARFPVLDKPDSTAAVARSYSTRSIAVSQHDKPQLFLMNSSGGDTVMDADTGEVLRKIDFAEGSAALVPGS